MILYKKGVTKKTNKKEVLLALKIENKSAEGFNSTRQHGSQVSFPSLSSPRTNESIEAEQHYLITKAGFFDPLHLS